MRRLLGKSRIGFWMGRLHFDRHQGFRPVPFHSLGDYLSHVENHPSQYELRARILEELATGSSPIVTRGHCICCQGERDFETDPFRWKANPEDTPNWREGLMCTGCYLTSRMRASVHMLRWAVRDRRRSRVYLTEQTTPLFRQVQLMYPQSVGSEYLRDGTKSGNTNPQGIRHEDLTALSFPDASFDAVVSLEVIEHVPDFRAAFSECARVLVSGGRLVLTVPFHGGPSHLLRARLKEDGSIEHLQPPEYHGDPLDPQGCLCFHHFGWDILDYLRQAGFRSTTAYSICVSHFGVHFG